MRWINKLFTNDSNNPKWTKNYVKVVFYVKEIQPELLNAYVQNCSGSVWSTKWEYYPHTKITIFKFPSTILSSRFIKHKSDLRGIASVSSFPVPHWKTNKHNAQEQFS